MLRVISPEYKIYIGSRKSDQYDTNIVKVVKSFVIMMFSVKFGHYDKY